MPESLAFLSYTRTDDEFFGGYISTFREVLEKAVHVVTGEKTFRIFQDIEGLVIGENWQKKLTEVIQDSSFLVPMLSPLFLNSTPCRDEVTQFLQHERNLNRDDLILPIYFLTSAKLEKEEEKNKDPLATEIAKRQRFDWREKADVPLQEPAARKAILELANAIAKRLNALEAKPPTPPAATKPGATLAFARERPELDIGAAGSVKREQQKSRPILWVDDNPENNEWERRALEAYGAQFVLALDTTEAERRIDQQSNFTAIISDMGRLGDPQAGYTLLDKIRAAKIDTPYFIYTTRRAATALQSTIAARGGQGITGDPDALVEMVVAAIK
jgi:CheY-like chemotaxis protein